MSQFIFGLIAGIVVGLVMEWVIDWTGLLPKRSAGSGSTKRASKQESRSAAAPKDDRTDVHSPNNAATTPSITSPSTTDASGE